jgi:hypothetical protein
MFALQSSQALCSACVRWSDGAWTTLGALARHHTPYVAGDNPGLSIAGIALASQMKIHMSIE